MGGSIGLRASVHEVQLEDAKATGCYYGVMESSSQVNVSRNMALLGLVDDSCGITCGS
jgi:hypothetical protein